ALTVTLKATPAVCAFAVPVLPDAAPGAALSPGARICNLANAPALTVIAGLVLAVLLPSLASEAVSVRLPAVLRMTLRFMVPPTKAVLTGRTALASEEVSPTVSVTFVTRFQLTSTARTVTVNAAPAARAVGVPVLPDTVPGAAASPG